MGVQEESEVPLELSVMKNPPTVRLDEKQYVIIKNHVREIPTYAQKAATNIPTIEPTSKSKKSANKSKESVKKKSEVISELREHNSASSTQISQKDLEELKTVYHKCKSVMNKIEKKYGHLLNLDATPTQTSDSNTEDECYCQANKKIIFDEDGQEIVTESELNNHVCPKKLKRRHSEQTLQPDNKKIAIQYEEQSIPLPNDLKSLANILQDSNIAISYRNEVINKVRLLKQEHLNVIKFGRPYLIEKLKKSQADASNIFEFKGANLFSLPGYPVWK